MRNESTSHRSVCNRLLTSRGGAGLAVPPLVPDVAISQMKPEYSNKPDGVQDANGGGYEGGVDACDLTRLLQAAAAKDDGDESVKT